MHRWSCRPIAVRSASIAAMALLLCLGQFALVRSSIAQESLVHRIQVKGAIGAGTSIMIKDALVDADRAKAKLLVMEIDTPGGLVASTREIITAMLASPVPVAVFIAPSGARAASAGTYIAFAAHFVGMASGTHMGAATPVSMTMPGMPGAPGSGQKDKEKPDQPSGSASERKVLNDAIAYLRSLAQLRGRSEDWADKFVRDAATITAAEALKEGLVDVVAEDVNALIRKLDGRTFTTTGASRTLSLANPTVETVAPGWKVKFLSAISDPNIAFILLMIGIYGIIFEFWSPGLTGPGVVGGISLIVGLFALSALPLSYAGLALLILGLVLMAGEAIAPGFGILGIGGIIAFILGAVFLFDPAGADIEIAIYTPLILAAAATSALLMIGLLGYLLRSRRRKVATGSEELIGLEGSVVSWTNGHGRVRVHGEIWSARSDQSLSAGAAVHVVERDGLTLIVR